jgi:hypothetical protein
MLGFSCPLCHRAFQVQASEDRSVRRCPHCHQSIVIDLNRPIDEPPSAVVGPALEVKTSPQTIDESVGTSPSQPSVIAPGRIVIPTELYIVAALFLAFGVFALIRTFAEAIDTRVIQTGGLIAAAIMLPIGWGLAKFRETARGWATVILWLGIVIRFLALALIGTFLVDYVNRNISDKSAADLRQGSSVTTWGVGPIERVSDGENVGYYTKLNDRREFLQPLDALQVALVFLFGICLNWWQLRVLQRPAARQVFSKVNHDHLAGQMSLTRFLALVTVVLSAYLVIWRAGWEWLLS